MDTLRGWLRTRRRAVAGALLAAAVVLAAGLQLQAIYRAHAIVDAKERLVASVSPRVDVLATAVGRRLSAVSALHAFTVVDPSPARLDAEFLPFVTDLFADQAGIRNLSLAPGGVQTYVYPLEGNAGVLGHNLLTDARAEVRADVARAIETGTITLSGPYELRQGGLGLVARLAVTVDDEFWGLVTAVLDVSPLLEDAGLSTPDLTFTFALANDAGQVFAGDEAVLSQDPVTAVVPLPESEWTLAVVPWGGWSAAVRGQMMVARAVWISLVALIAGLAYLLAGREQQILEASQRLARHSAESQSWYKQELGRDESGWVELVWRAGADALRITLVYLSVSALWIVLSDRLLLALGLTAEVVTEIQTLKGWLFVIVTGTALYVVIRRRLVQVHQAMALAVMHEQKYRMLADNTLDVIWRMDLDFVFTYVNPAIEELLGYSADEVVGTSLEVYAPAEAYQRLSGVVTDALRRQDIIGGLQIEVKLRHRDGSLVPVEIRGSILTDDRGEPLGVQGLAHSTRERDAAEREREQLVERIREQMLLVERIIATVPDGVLLLDETRRPTLANPAAESFLKLQRQPDVDDTGPLTHLGDRALIEVLAAPPEGLWHEVRSADRVFEVVARQMVGHWVSEGALGDRWVLVLHDATEEREVRVRVEEQARLSALGQMAAGIAHDFNNILAVVVLYTQMSLRAPELGSVTQERLRIILDQADRATALVQQILDFGRRTTMEVQEIDLVRLLTDETELLRRTLPESIVVSFAHSGGPCYAAVDTRRIQQALMNLAVNARDAMPAGGELRLSVSDIRVDSTSVSPLPDLAEGHWVTITIEDTGDGIPPELVQRIFEPFFTTKGPGKGSGLGLAQVYGIVQQHGGQIGVSSDVGKGTRFTLCLPAARVAISRDELSDLAAAPRGTGERVLLVEDHAATRVALTDSLELLNYRVITATHGGEALAALEDPDCDVAIVLSDYVMPEVDGRDLFLALKARGMPVPMVILTGHSLAADLDDLVEAGLSGWLPKPPDLARLAHLLERALSRQMP